MSSFSISSFISTICSLCSSCANIEETFDNDIVIAKKIENDNLIIFFIFPPFYIILIESLNNNNKCSKIDLKKRVSVKTDSKPFKKALITPFR